MARLTIDISDDLADALSVKLTANGLTLEDWFCQRAQEELRSRKRYTIEELVNQCDPEAPFSAEDREWLGSPSED